MTADDSFNRLDDDDYPAYTMGRAAEMLGTTQGFLRALGEARLITPLRSAGGHRRYSRYQLRIAARARELVDQGTPIRLPHHHPRRPARRSPAHQRRTPPSRRIGQPDERSLKRLDTGLFGGITGRVLRSGARKLSSGILFRVAHSSHLNRRRPA